MAKMDLVLSEIMQECGIRQYIEWDTEKAPHCAISGITGTGKTYLAKLLLARISKNLNDAQITICDFKGDRDFSFLSGCEGFFRFEDCGKGFDSFYESFVKRQRDNDSESFNLLLFDEWASYLNYLEKKDAEVAKRKLESLLMLSRSFNYHIILSQQRLNAESFGKSRDNFNLVIVLGNPSKEVQEMLFSDYKNEISPDRNCGTGYLLVNGTNFERIIVPQITNIELVNEYIKQAVKR